MIKYNKKKGIIYVNDCKNAESLYKLLKKQDKLNVYIYVSKNIQVENDSPVLPNRKQVACGFIMLTYSYPKEEKNVKRCSAG